MKDIFLYQVVTYVTSWVQLTLQILQSYYSLQMNL